MLRVGGRLRPSSQRDCPPLPRQWLVLRRHRVVRPLRRHRAVSGRHRDQRHHLAAAHQSRPLAAARQAPAHHHAIQIPAPLRRVLGAVARCRQPLVHHRAGDVHQPPHVLRVVGPEWDAVHRGLV